MHKKYFFGLNGCHWKIESADGAIAEQKLPDGFEQRPSEINDRAFIKMERKTHGSGTANGM